MKFLNSVFRDVQEHAADGIVVVIGAIDGDTAAAAELSGGGDHHRVLLGWVEVRGGCVAGHEEGEFEEVAAVEGEFVNLVRSDNAINDG